MRRATDVTEKGFQVVNIRIGRKLEVDEEFSLPSGEWKIQFKEPDNSFVKFIDDWCEPKRRTLARQIITSKFELVSILNPSMRFRIVAHDRIVKPPVQSRNLIKYSIVRDPEIAGELDLWRKYRTESFDKAVSKSMFNEPEVIVIDDTPDILNEYLSRIQELTLTNQQLQDRIEVPQTINPYVAKILIRAALNEVCPVALEQLSSFNEFAVAICGHVCSSEVKALDKCPVCRTNTKWQILKKSDI